MSELVVGLADMFDSTTIIVDGLDECEREDWSSVTSQLVSLSKHTARQSPIKLLLTSRKEYDIERELEDFTKLSIAARSSDLHLYVAQQLAEKTQNGSLKLRSPDLKTLILDKLVDGAQGM